MTGQDGGLQLDFPSVSLRGEINQSLSWSIERGNNIWYNDKLCSISVYYFLLNEKQHDSEWQYILSY